MHMTPIKYSDYAKSKENIFEIAKKQIQEKIIFQSICYFTIATEIRFIEVGLKTKGD